MAGLFLINTESWSQLLINEFVASNSSGGYYDAVNYNFPDWIEIYNASATGRDLSNYYLTDDLSDLNKWKIPAGTYIAAKGYLLFLADDKVGSLPSSVYRMLAPSMGDSISNETKGS